MELSRLTPPSPNQKTIIAKSIILVVLFVIILLGQFWLPKPNLDRAKAPLESSPAVLGLRSDISIPASPLEKLDTTFNEKIESKKAQIALSIQNKKESFILMISDQIASQSSHLRKKLLEFYLSRLSNGLPEILPTDQAELKDQITTLLFTSPSPEASFSSYLELPLLTPIDQ